ncbi:MAG: PEP-CTERM sorting domain-containing protein [Gammaproteobacteria bacterium]|nr:PEP-CTERM sorting domain-containing protein [Gammaproteobacteria bacterium]
MKKQMLAAGFVALMTLTSSAFAVVADSESTNNNNEVNMTHKVPAPAALICLAVGIAGLVVSRRRR